MRSAVLPIALVLPSLLIVACAPGSMGVSHGPRPIDPSDDGGGPPPGYDAGPRPDSGPIAPPPPLDTDRDGLPDEDERGRGTDPANADTDGDGVGDGVEVLAGTDPTDPSSTIPPTDFYVILPFEDPAQTRELDFTARLGKADVFFLIDTTGSMGGAISNVQSTLSTVIVPAIDAAIADSRMGVAEYRDFPTSPYGGSGDFPFRLRQTNTDSIPAVQAGLRALVAGGGADGPESMVEAVYETAMGACSTGAGRGQACFRGDATPIVVVVTDIVTHNGPGGSNGYSFAARRWDEAVAAMNSIGAKVLGASVGSSDNLRDLANATTSRRADGSPTVYPARGGAVDTAVVDGIVDLVGGVPQDVSRRTIDDVSDDVDATRFMREVRPARASRMVRMDETTFYGVPGGTTVTFEVVFENDFLPHGDTVRIFRAQIEVHDVPALTPLDTRNVYVVVPARDGSILI